MDIKKQYLLHIRITEKSHTPEGLKYIYSRIFKILQDFVENRGDLHLAYTSHDGSTMGFLVRTPKDSRQIMTHLRTGEKTTRSPLYDNDQILIIELGNDVNGTQDFSLVMKWLNRG